MRFTAPPKDKKAASAPYPPADKSKEAQPVYLLGFPVNRHPIAPPLGINGTIDSLGRYTVDNMPEMEVCYTALDSGDVPSPPPGFEHLGRRKKVKMAPTVLGFPRLRDSRAFTLPEIDMAMFRAPHPAICYSANPIFGGPQERKRILPISPGRRFADILRITLGPYLVESHNIPLPPPPTWADGTRPFPKD